MTESGLPEELIRAGLLQPKARDPKRVGRWLERSIKDLNVVATLADVDRQRAMAVAYEAGYRACAGILDLEGHRVTSPQRRQRLSSTNSSRTSTGYSPNWNDA